VLELARLVQELALDQVPLLLEVQLWIRLLVLNHRNP
jgi:hypothetical protein